MDRDKRLPALNAALGLIVVLLVVQMWLLTTTLEAYLAGHHDTVLPGAAISLILFGACGSLYLFIGLLDRRSRRD